MPHDFHEFDAMTVPLEHSNLIEASAGTGKTYSIAILALRLILEKEMPVNEILMVTFSKAAVAELQERIRLFIRQANQYAKGGALEQADICRLVDESREKRGEEETATLLRRAQLLLDEAPVLTIHSFCQKVLNEFAFETGKDFSATLMADMSAVVDDALNEFWRKSVSTLPTAFLKHIGGAGVRGQLSSAITEHLRGKWHYGYEEGEVYTLNEAICGSLLQEHQEANAVHQQGLEDLKQYVRDHATELENTFANGGKRAADALIPLLKDPDSLLNFIANKTSTQYVQKSCGPLLERLEELEELAVTANHAKRNALLHVIFSGIRAVSEAVRSFKRRNAILGYDDLIADLYTALQGGENTRLIEALRKKYTAVFVDEFQDTDRLQYEIFETLFQRDAETVLFYIGDPKQSIYGFRSADVFTYLQARDAVAHRYTMNTNFRSTPKLVEAMNHFFLPKDNFDTFHFGEGDAGIRYQKVEARFGQEEAGCWCEDNMEVPITIFKAEKVGEIAQIVAEQVARLLQKKFFRVGPNKEAGVWLKPSDIGILVRKHGEAADIKNALTALGIPSVTVNDNKVLQSEEATILFYFLQAIQQPSAGTIARALLNNLTGYTVAELQRLDAEKALARFSHYRELLQRSGVYVALDAFVKDFDLHGRMAGQVGSERALANLTQLIELLHAMQVRKAWNVAELAAWLKRGIDGMTIEGDEYTQRVESDEDAVVIATIHKSKGLAYKVVLAPYLDFSPPKNSKTKTFTYRDPETSRYYSLTGDRMTDAQRSLLLEQDEQENRRLLYVAITRTEYKLYLFRSESQSNTTLATFINHIQEDKPELICFAGEQAPPKPYQPEAATAAGSAKIKQVKLPRDGWRKLSYTRLAGEHEFTRHPYAPAPEDLPAYERFIRYDLPRGNKTGDMVHYLLERADFAYPDRWDDVVAATLRRYPQQKELDWSAMLSAMLRQLTSATIQPQGAQPFTLSSVRRSNRLAELEFDFPLSSFEVSTLLQQASGIAPVVLRPFEEEEGKLEGLLNGKIDLFFEHDGKYYILDWKSNYLGPERGDYDHAHLEAAMAGNNYHLQYLLYTVAVKRYLESRLEHFDYHTQFGGALYFFIRGVYDGEKHGIFYAKPPAEAIQNLEDLLCSKRVSRAQLA